MRIDRAIVRQLEFELITPYKLSWGPMHRFEPFVVELVGTDGRSGWGEALIVPGYTTESVGGSWDRLLELAGRVTGSTLDDARGMVRASIAEYPGVASALLGAIDMLAGHRLLTMDTERRVPLLAPCQAMDPAAIRDEVASLFEQGFRTLKVKVGNEWRADLRRVECIQQALAGRGTIRLDANQAFSQEDGVNFAVNLSPDGIELFEQPCAADDWDANARVAARSAIPVMLDESIYDIADVDRAATIPGVGFVKLKLKKIGALDDLERGLTRIRALGLTPVLGDGVSIEIGCWMECCVAHGTIDNAGEMNGFLKTRTRLFVEPLPFEGGHVVLRRGWWPEVDRDVVAAHERARRDYAAPRVPG